MGKGIQRRKSAADPQANGRLIAIRARGEDNELIEASVDIKSAPALVRMAMQWGYILRVRTRWAGDADMRGNFDTRAFKDLTDLGIKADAIRKFASVERIEVEFRVQGLKSADEKALLDAVSEIPWEFLLSAATQSVGRFKSLLVTRCLSNGTTVAPTKPRDVLFVESAPGRIAQIYSFDDEEERLRAAMGLKENTNPEENRGLTFSRTEPFSKLKGRLSKKAWDVVHVTGVDTHQAAWLIEDFYTAVVRRNDVIDTSDCLHDGMILRGDYDSELPVRHDELADLLIEPPKCPAVITLNLYYSGTRTSRELIKRGAYAALGFLDEIDDEFAELFFQAFYWAWCRDNQSIPDAFLDAWSAMDGDRIHGTGIVIWLGRSIFAQPDTPARKIAAARKQQGGGH